MGRRLTGLAATMAAAVALVASQAQATTVVDFNEFTANTNLGSYFESQGYSFSSSFGGLRTPINSVDADPSGRAVGNILPGAVVTVQKVGGGLFDLISMDFADRLNVGFSGPIYFDFSNGGSLTSALNASSGLQTIALNQSGLTSFTFRTKLVSPLAGYYQFDNMAVDVPAPSAVPEPATWAMMIIGFFGLGAALRRGRRAASDRLSAAPLRG